jgi:hypothetical protein
MTLPDFLIIGAAKSGTTTLYQYLCQHPKIYMSHPKEPDFFALDSQYAKGLDWYRGLFATATADQICGEASTTYSRLQQHPEAAKRIAANLPRVKLIYIMRHPVERAYSFYVHRLKGSRYRPEFAVAKTFEETIKQQSEFLDSSYYLYQIEEYLHFFSKESFLFLLMEDLIQDPAKTVNQVFKFLEVDSQVDVINGSPIVANKATDNPAWAVRSQLTSPFKAIPGVKALTSVLPRNFKDVAYQAIKRLNYDRWLQQQYLPPAMLPETRQKLLLQFDESNQKLAEFLNRDLSHWNQ